MPLAASGSPPVPAAEPARPAITDFGGVEPVLRFSRVVVLPTALRADRDLFARAYRTQDCWLSYAWPSPPDVLGDHARMVIRATRPSSISNAKCDEPFEVPLEVSTVSTIVWPMRSTRVRSIRTSLSVKLA